MVARAKKIAFFGTPAFVASFLDELYDEGFVSSLIVTNPDRPSGRGMRLMSPEPKVWADTHGVTVLQPEKLDENFMTELSKETWDLFVVIAYGKILPEKLINIPKFGTINVHYSLLPKYRGATPVESAILNGDETTGVCIQQMRFKLDSGPILAQKKIALLPDDTTLTLREKLNDIARPLVPEVMRSIFLGITPQKEQDASEATFCKKISKEDGLVNLSEDPEILYRKWRAYTHSPGVFFIAKKDGQDVRVKIKIAKLINGKFIIETAIPENGKPLDTDALQRWLTS